MTRLFPKLLVLSLFTVSSAWAQGPGEQRKPSPELQKEGEYYLGTWKFTGETKDSPFAPGGQKFESSERLEWLPGGFFLMARSYESDNKWSGLTILGYDESRRVFTHTSYTAKGEVETMEGTIQGDTETWSGYRQVGGKLTRQRLTIRKISPTLYTFRFELAPGNGNWSLVYAGQAVKTPE